ncbi:efflux RND transporter periplasmic adaptor subunit [Flavobacterium sp. MAH-1]|uniref:Efflux RND transporter periplasmic adaptor subunit n=1 Tax=Flavobacterium agri TaxID=2743471 RepID=A0A7Y9C7B6_9FLAO|nr:efflux RND transporter periplasmic adaptor subunit [Flavobacterium agri]NUY82190.1 efflux RND transporter periplasmic adaptor subunit [Flavobacterium agri]NYA72214.1 efflux RND transporter periplasmic adaptor subunit [Flavobacterium agri]
MKNSLFFYAIGALIITACAHNQASAPQAAAPALPVISIANTDAVTDAEFPAALQGTVDIEIRPQVSGNLERILVDEGAYVTKGQPLFKINEQPFREQLNNATAQLRAAEAAQTNAQLEVEKLTPLVANNVVSDYQLKTAKAAFKIATANVEQARAAVGSAKINLGYTSISAPVSGYIGRLPKKQGSLVSPADFEAMTTLSDVHEVYAYFSLGESDFIRFKTDHEGATLNEKLKKLPAVKLVLSDNSAYEQTGRIDMIDGQFDKTTGAITLRAKFPNAKGLLRSGNTGKVLLSLPHSDAILVPQEATIEIQDKIFVFTVDKSNKVSKQPIAVSGKTDNSYLVESGVKPGDRIVFKGFENLQEGAIIKPEEEKILAKN